MGDLTGPIIGVVGALLAVVLGYALTQRGKRNEPRTHPLTEPERQRLEVRYRATLDVVDRYREGADRWVTGGGAPGDYDAFNQAGVQFQQAARDARLGASIPAVQAMDKLADAMMEMAQALMEMGDDPAPSPRYTAAVAALEGAEGQFVNAARRDVGIDLLG